MVPILGTRILGFEQRDCVHDNEHFLDLTTQMGMFLKPVYTLMEQTQRKMFKSIFTRHDGPQITTEVMSYDQRQITILAHRWIIILPAPPVVQSVSATRVALVASDRAIHSASVLDSVTLR